MIRRIRNRYAEVRMLHICLGVGWHYMDVVYVLMGHVL